MSAIKECFEVPKAAQQAVFDLLLGTLRFLRLKVMFSPLVLRKLFSVLGQPPSLKFLPTESALKLVILCSFDASL
jgi:hypothetical protein